MDTDIDFIMVHNVYTRGHSNKLTKQHCTIDATRFYFSNRVISIWNSLSEQYSLLPLSLLLNLLQYVIFMCKALFLSDVVICVMLCFFFFFSIWLCLIDCMLHVLFAVCAFTDSVSGLLVLVLNKEINK